MSRGFSKDSKKKGGARREFYSADATFNNFQMVQQSATRELFVIDRSFTPSFGAKSTPNTVRASTAGDWRCHSTQVARIDAVVEEADRAVS